MNKEVVDFLDYSKIDWERVKCSRYFFYQRFHYEYPGPIRNLHQRLIAVPSDRYGDQRVCDHQLISSPESHLVQEVTDSFGNRVHEMVIQEIEKSATFEVITTIERSNSMEEQAVFPPALSQIFLQPTKLTKPDERISKVARELRDKAHSTRELVEIISVWVHSVMRYGAGATDVKTDASQALQTGQGLCQDFAHLMIALCREAELPARYVSGHMLGEGGSHAWVEVLLPSDEHNRMEIFAIDPTNQRRPNLKYITVATGRDYSDVPPTSGSFMAPYQGQLKFTKKAGLTSIEYRDGEIMDSSKL